MRKIAAFSLILFFGGAPALRAQGMLPLSASSNSSSSSTVAEVSRRPLLIGDKVPETLAVLGENGKERTLLSYKSALDVFVVGFFSGHCDAGDKEWVLFRRLGERYKEWRVAFLAVNLADPSTLPALSAALKQAKVPWPLVQDHESLASSFFKISAVPDVVILDESGFLRFRGPVEKAPAALDALIGHLEALPEPEPPVTGGCPVP